MFKRKNINETREITDKGFRDSIFFEPYKRIAFRGEYMWWRLRGSPGPKVPHIVKQRALAEFAGALRPSRDGRNRHEPGPHGQRAEGPLPRNLFDRARTNGWPLAPSANSPTGRAFISTKATAAPFCQRLFRISRSPRSSGSTRTGAISMLQSSRNSSASIAIPSAIT